MKSVMYTVGEKIRHRQRPEWGIGTISKVEVLTRQGQRDHRIWIRFPNAGTKTVLGSVADLEPVGANAAVLAVAEGGETFAAREAAHESGWLGEIAKRRPEDAMTSIPSRANDPFLSLAKRLEFVASLYRFEPVGGKLIDWAVAQSGLDDPLARFNRHELEAFFQRWAYDRDAALARLVMEGRRTGTPIDDVLVAAPPAAQRALRKLIAAR